MDMADSVPPGGVLKLADDLVLSRMGFGAMQLAGPGVFGPPRDRDQALASCAKPSRPVSPTSTPATSTVPWWSTS